MAPQRSYELGRVPRTLVGVEALNGLGAALDLLSGSEAVVIADPGVQATGYIDRALAALRPRDLTVHLVPWGEPTVESVDAAAQVVRDLGDPIVIGVGGGSALDIAKQAAVISTGPSGVEPYPLCAEPLTGRRSIMARRDPVSRRHRRHDERRREPPNAEQQRANSWRVGSGHAR